MTCSTVPSVTEDAGAADEVELFTTESHKRWEQYENRAVPPPASGVKLRQTNCVSGFALFAAASSFFFPILLPTLFSSVSFKLRDK